LAFFAQNYPPSRLFFPAMLKGHARFSPLYRCEFFPIRCTRPLMFFTLSRVHRIRSSFPPLGRSIPSLFFDGGVSDFFLFFSFTATISFLFPKHQKSFLFSAKLFGVEIPLFFPPPSRNNNTAPPPDKVLLPTPPKFGQASAQPSFAFCMLGLMRFPSFFAVKMALSPPFCP